MSLIPNLREVLILIKDVGPNIIPIFQAIAAKCFTSPAEVFKSPKVIGTIIIDACRGKVHPVKIAQILVGLICGKGGAWILFMISTVVPGAGIVLCGLAALAGNFIGYELGKNIVIYVANECGYPE